MTKIMLVEDDLVMLNLLQTLLKMEGYQTAVWNAQEDILTEIRKEKPEIVLLDINLRGENGFDVLEQMRADPDLKHCRVIITSGLDYKDHCQEAGANGFILKPYMPEELFKLIRENLD